MTKPKEHDPAVEALKSQIQVLIRASVTRITIANQRRLSDPEGYRKALAINKSKLTELIKVLEPKLLKAKAYDELTSGESKNGN